MEDVIDFSSSFQGTAHHLNLTEVCVSVLLPAQMSDVHSGKTFSEMCRCVCSTQSFPTILLSSVGWKFEELKTAILSKVAKWKGESHC